jgi:pilus assembly protein CpaB
MSRWHNRAKLQQTAVRLVVAGGLAVVSMLAAESWLAGAGGANAAVPMAEVLVTAHALEAGARLRADDLVARPWPASAIDASWLAADTPLVGRMTVARIAAGTPISRAMLVASGGSSFSAGIAPGHRAISIAVSPAGGLAGFLAPGDRVDVLLTQTLGKRRTVQTLIGNLVVLGVDQHGGSRGGDVVAQAVADRDDEIEPPGLVTLDVSPRDAEALAVAAELGILSLVLRGPSAEPAAPRGRRWDSDITGLPVALLAPSDAVPAGPMAAMQSTTPQSAPASGVAISYGLQAATPEAAK